MAGAPGRGDAVDGGGDDQRRAGARQRVRSGAAGGGVPSRAEGVGAAAELLTPELRFPLSAFRFPLSAFRFPLSAFRRLDVPRGNASINPLSAPPARSTPRRPPDA